MKPCLFLYFAKGTLRIERSIPRAKRKAGTSYILRKNGNARRISGTRFVSKMGTEERVVTLSLKRCQKSTLKNYSRSMLHYEDLYWTSLGDREPYRQYVSNWD